MPTTKMKAIFCFFFVILSFILFNLRLISILSLLSLFNFSIFFKLDLIFLFILLNYHLFLYLTQYKEWYSLQGKEEFKIFLNNL